MKWYRAKASPEVSAVVDRKAYNAEYYRLRRQDPEFVAHRRKLIKQRKERGQ